MDVGVIGLGHMGSGMTHRLIEAGCSDQVARRQPLLDAMAQKSFDAGEVAPNANVIKLAGNFTRRRRRPMCRCRSPSWCMTTS